MNFSYATRVTQFKNNTVGLVPRHLGRYFVNHSEIYGKFQLTKSVN